MEEILSVVERLSGVVAALMTIIMFVSWICENHAKEETEATVI